MSHPADFLGKTLDGGRIRLIEMLGEGAYGVVFRAIDDRSHSRRSSSSSSSSSPRRGPHEYAVKILEKATEDDARHFRFQQREISAQICASGHPNVVSIYGVFECAHYLYIVLEFCDGGNLLGVLSVLRVFSRNDELVKTIFCQVLDGVEHCHKAGVFHRDLKPENILLNKDRTQAKVADFGLATTAKISDTFDCGSSYYMSPECIGVDYNYRPYATDASDVWSLGIIFLNLIAGRHPWEYATLSDQAYVNFLADPFSLRQTLPISEEAVELARAILNPDPVARITIPELRARIRAAHTFFMSEDEIAVGNKYVQNAAATYAPLGHDVDYITGLIGQQSIACEEEAWEMLKDPLANAMAPPSMSYQLCRPSYDSKEKRKEKKEKKSAAKPSPESDSGLPKPPLPPRKRPVGPPVKREPKFVIVHSSGISASSSCSSSRSSSESESEGPVTPATHAQDPAKLADIPEFSESEKIGRRVVSFAGKDRATPMETVHGPVAIPVVA